MGFQQIRPVEKVDKYLDAAFFRAKKRIQQLKSPGKKITAGQQRKMEYIRLDIIKDTLEEKLSRILKDFPNVDQLNDFYKELVKITIDYVQFKKSLGAVNTAVHFLRRFHKEYMFKFKRFESLKEFDRLRREFYGRISSVLYRIKNELSFLEECRQVMRNYPSIKEIPTIAIAGFPNVGKSTLLNKLSTAKAKTAEYAFTTKGLNLGYMTLGSKKLQLIDTPGTLNRLEKMNDIERQAYLVIKHLTDLIIYVFDLSEPFPLKDQEKLFKHLKQEKKKMLVYFSKSDILELDEKLVKKYKGFIDVEKLKAKIKKLF